MIRYVKKRITQLSIFLLFGLFFLQCILIIRMVRTIVLIRFCRLPSSLIGHAAYDPEYHLSKKKKDGFNAKILDLYYFNDEVIANQYWANLVKKNLPISPVFKYLDFINRWLPGGEEHYLKSVSEQMSTMDQDELFHKTHQSILLNEKENDIGLKFLNEIGLPKGSKFICLHVRDSANDQIFDPSKMGVDHSEYRNAKIENYVKVAEKLADMGYLVIRMGKSVNNKIPTTHPMVFDYACSGKRTELLDIFLCFNCYFMITTSSGIDSLAYIGRRPHVVTNFLNYSEAVFHYSRALFIFKKVRYKKSDKFLNLMEMLQIDSEQSAKYTSFYRERRLEYIENSSDEILDVVLEMEQRLSGKWEETDITLKNQKLFNNIFKEYCFLYKQFGMNKFTHKLSSEFTKKNEWFLVK
jgi:putative glycosyltransferase (TIGR04372 family)